MSASSDAPPAVHYLRPLEDPRWAEFVDRHPRSSAFHTVPWLRALYQTYGYEPLACTTSPPGTNLENGLVFCRVESWITGRRIVSLPFSDHCEPLVETAAEEHALVSALLKTFREERLRYVEVRGQRPVEVTRGFYISSPKYCFHRVDLRPDLNALFANCHKSSTQRKIQRAEREGLRYEAGRSDALFGAFWNLLVVTRRRHGVPPQPKSWFRNLIDGFGADLQIRVAFAKERPVASILTLRHKDTLIYKYGCSDAECNQLGGTHLLFWRSIQEAKREGLRVFDLGRSAYDNPGLITFKDRWGSNRSNLLYSRLSTSPPAESAEPDSDRWTSRLARRVVSSLPDRALRLAGSILYKHIG
jgi:CelD/BcsL family acetyltransferase involved in cellulose biosynthesis